METANEKWYNGILTTIDCNDLAVEYFTAKNDTEAINTAKEIANDYNTYGTREWELSEVNEVNGESEFFEEKRLVWW